LFGSIQLAIIFLFVVHGFFHTFVVNAFSFGVQVLTLRFITFDDNGFQLGAGRSLIDTIICPIFFNSHDVAHAYFNSLRNHDNLDCTSIGFILSQRRFLNNAEAIALVGSENACFIIGKSTIMLVIFAIVVGGGVLPL
jgi:hypothetical protein